MRYMNRDCFMGWK